MKAFEVNFKEGKCYKASNFNNTRIKLFKFKRLSLFGQTAYVDASRGISISDIGITLNWVTSYIEDDLDIEEINETVIDKVEKLFSISRVSMINATNTKLNERN